MDPVNSNPHSPGQQEPIGWRSMLGVLLSVQRWPAPTRQALRSLLLWILLAPLAWALLALWLAWLQQQPASEFGGLLKALAADMQTPQLLAPLRELAWNSADTLGWPVAAVSAFVLIKGVVGKRWSPGKSSGTAETKSKSEFERTVAAAAEARAKAKAAALPPSVTPVEPLETKTHDAFWITRLVLEVLRVAPFAATACAALWAVLVGLAIINDKDHWEALPWVTPPHLTEFKARHPKLIVEPLRDADGRVIVHDGKGRGVRLESAELALARVRLEACPAGLGAEQLGGIPPYPGLACVTLVHLDNDYGAQRLYVFDARGSSDQANNAIHAHFDRWAMAQGGGTGSSADHKSGRQWLSAGRGAWRVEVASRPGRGANIVIRHRTEVAR